MNMIKRAFFFGLGALSMTRETAEKMYAEIMEKGEMNREEARQFIDEAIKKGREEKEALLKIIQDEMDKFRNEMAPVSRSEFAALEQRVRELEMRVKQES
ncbi:MAG: phasin family protein [Syntrophomonadaceae bacterium]